MSSGGSVIGLKLTFPDEQHKPFDSPLNLRALQSEQIGHLAYMRSMFIINMGII